MANIDLIELALAAPIDWEKFETIICDILGDDDLPKIRKLGGRGDHGMDATEESYYSLTGSIDTAIQITSQKAQKIKVSDTLKKLAFYNIKAKQLIMVFRDTCAASTLRDIRDQGIAAGIHIDVRDRSYIVRRLGSKDSKVFARHFSGDIQKQVKLLLEKPDPLNQASDELKRSVFASMATYSLTPHSRLVHGKLFERTVLAIIAATDKPITKNEILEKAALLLPENNIIQDTQITSAINNLKTSNDIVGSDSGYSASKEALIRVGTSILSVQSAHEDIQQWVRSSVETLRKLNDAEIGYIERNVREAIALIIRLIAPRAIDATIPLDKNTEKDLHRILSKNISPDLGKKALAAIAGYVSDEDRRTKLAPFVRAYTTLAIRNLDPIGKQWQASILSRSIIALDTDAVLKLIVTDLPEHNAIKAALESLAKEGVQIIIPDNVLKEAHGHIERAQTTFNKFRENLLQLPLSIVDSKVWHAVVRGYAYAQTETEKPSWSEYYNRYYDQDDSLNYLIRILKKRVPAKIEDLHELPASDLEPLRELTDIILTKKEQSRLKADFRGNELMHERVERDLRMLFSMAHKQSSSFYTAKGYLVTEDRALFYAEDSAPWSGRPHVAMMTRSLPVLTDFVCDARLDDTDIVRLVFEPLVAATAELLGDEIETLTKAGADLHKETLDQIEWKLEKGLRKKIHEFNCADELADQTISGELSLELIEAVSRADIQLIPSIAEVAENYRALVQTSAEEKAELDRIKKSIEAALFEVAGQSSKGRARANKMLASLGLSTLPDPEEQKP